MCGCVEAGNKNYHEHDQYPTNNQLSQTLEGYYTKTEIDDLISGLQDQIDSLTSLSDPIGTIKIWPRSHTFPTGWMECNGATLDKTVYPDLFDVVGLSFWTGGSPGNNFSLPDLRGRVPAGRDGNQSEFLTVGTSGGSNVHILTVGQLPPHDHSIKSRGIYPSTGAAEADARQGTVIGSKTEQTGSGQAHNNLQPYLTLTFLIRAT